MRPTNFPLISSSSEAEVPQEATPLALNMSCHLELVGVDASRSEDFKCGEVTTIREGRLVEILPQRKFNASVGVDKALLLRICGFLDSRDLLCLRNACRNFRKLALTVLLQRSLLEQTFEAMEW